MILEVEFDANVDALADIVHHYIVELLRLVRTEDCFDYFLPNYVEVHLYSCLNIARTT